MIKNRSLGGLFCRILIKLSGDPKKYSCLTKRKMHNRREIFKTEICLDYQ